MKKNNWLTISIIVFGLFMFMLGLSIISFISYKIYNEKSLTNSKVAEKCIEVGFTHGTTFLMIAFGAILIAILLPNIQSLSFAGANITMRSLKNDVNDLIELNNDLQEKAINNDVEKIPIPPKAANKERLSQTEGSDYQNDPQKGKWGGKADSNGRHLRAVVKEGAIPGLYRVELEVTGDRDNPLKGLVKFHLHDTFRNPNPIIAATNNVAHLNLKYVYGAFTVGVETDNGTTKLELDLAEMEDAPKRFREL